MRRIKILYTIPNFDTSGSGKALLNLALGLHPNRFEVEIMCLHDKGDFFKTVKASGFKIHIVDFLPKERPVYRMFTQCFKLSRIFKSIQPDIIHSFHYSSNYTEAIAAKMAGVRWVFTKKNMSWGGSSKNSWKLRSLLADKIVVQNKDMIRLFYSDSSKIKLIPRGINLEQFMPASKDVNLVFNYTTNSRARILLCVANLVPIKGIEIAIKAFKEIHDQFMDWEFWIVGDNQNKYAKSLLSFVEDISLGHKIKFVGRQISVKKFLDVSELFVLPSLDKGEGSPVALLEAMANSKVVLGSNVPGISDQLEDFKNHLFKAGDHLDLSNKLNYWMSKDTKELHEAGTLFNEHVKNNFTIALEVKRHETFYKTVCKS
ncbi:MAG: glycosyltransferase [Flavobacterium sp.]